MSCLVYLLPYLEQQNIYRQLQVNLNVNHSGPNWWMNQANWTMAQTRIKLFLCPSDDPYRSTEGTSIARHAAHVPGLRTDEQMADLEDQVRARIEKQIPAVVDADDGAEQELEEAKIEIETL